MAGLLAKLDPAPDAAVRARRRRAGHWIRHLAMSARQMELFGAWGRREIPAPAGGTGSQRERTDAYTSEAPIADTCARGDRSQDRHRSPPIGQGPVQTIGLAQALGKLPPFDFSAAIARDPRAVPMPDVPVPEWLRLPGVDLPANARSAIGSPSTDSERPPGGLSRRPPSARGSAK